MQLKRLSSLAMAGLLLFGLCQCSGTSGGQNNNNTQTPDTAEDAGNVATSQSTVTQLATSSTTAMQSVGNAQNLIKAKALATYVANNQQRYVTGSYDLGTVSGNCLDSGTMDFSGTISYDVNETTFYTIMNGDFGISFNACANTVTVEASDGECDVTAVLDGDIEMGYDYEGSAQTWSLDATWSTPADIDLTINDSAHTMGMDMGFSFSSSDSDISVTGTITIDGNAYDVTTPVDTTEYTRADLGC